MKTINLPAGSAEWIKSRSASKAAAMMGDDPKTSRTDLIRMMATGLGKEFTEWQQKNLLDKGNATEGGTRDIAEDVIGDGLSPACASTDDGYLTAAPDGVTFDGRIGFEAKTWNEKLAAAVRAQELPKSHHWQLDQQIIVFGLEYVLFCVSDGTRENFVSMEYRSTPERAAKLLAGWKQLDEDVAAYTHVEAAPVAVAAPVRDLPVLFVQARGEVTSTNLPEFKVAVSEYLAGLNMTPTDDQAFADSKAIAANLRAGAKALQAKKAEMLAQTASIGEVASECDLISKQLNAAALALEKKVDTEEENRKGRLIQKGKDALAAHIAALGQRIDTTLMPLSTADFAKAIKGKSKLESMENGIATELARATIEANAAADKIDANLKLLDAAKEHAFLFHDRATLVMKDAETLALYIKSRITEHQAIEAKRLEAIKEAARIEAEANAAAKVKAEQEEADRKRIAAGREANAKAREAAMPKVTETIDHGDGIKTIVVQGTEPAAQPAPAASSRRLDETVAAAAHTGITGSARLLDRLDDLARQMTERELSELCIHAAHILEQRRAAA